MDYKNIQTLLDKYWEGETSLKEETTLREFFNQENIPQEFEAVQPLFQFFKQEQEANLNGDFEERLSSKLKAADNVKPRSHSLSFYIKRVAAVAAIMTGVLFFFNNDVFTDKGTGITANHLSVQEKEEAKLAYAEAKSALLLMSKKLKKGTRKAEEGISIVQKATKVIRN